MLCAFGGAYVWGVGVGDGGCGMQYVSGGEGVHEGRVEGAMCLLTY